MEKNIYRIIDANTNRCLEGLRVCEDFCRFVINNKDISLALKKIRHDLLAVVKKISALELLDGRNVSADSVKFCDEKNELKRESPLRIINANIHRATEAIRSIEEYSKYLDTNMDSGSFQQIRFKLYEIEKKIIYCLEQKNKLQKIDNSNFVTIEVVKGSLNKYFGKINTDVLNEVSVINFKFENYISNEEFKIVKDISEVCKLNNKLLFVTGSLEIALLVKADGIIITQKNLLASEYKKIIPFDMLIGLQYKPDANLSDQNNKNADFFINISEKKSGEIVKLKKDQSRLNEIPLFVN